MIKLAIFDNKIKSQTYADQIHQWLIAHRPGYNATKWCDIEAGKDDSELRYYIKIPPDYELLNASIPIPEERLTLPATATEIVDDKLPDNWRVKAIIDDDGKLLIDDEGKILIE
jgi:hypothetical protein